MTQHGPFLTKARNYSQHMRDVGVLQYGTTRNNLIGQVPTRRTAVSPTKLSSHIKPIG